ncbi:hypothetical protein [Methylobacter sp. S3L5C]|uniref:hypothetical protein n=1 Tax=Methylobacter sp. S3L5C TaxID=2839024 RepID=UPI001FAD3C22|nr:hypothetical protein [Methylobacter sp. S3L5C]UOA08574.1 hypothetical protein KKZ03_20675 [Methylobacter sp. S3L5C]
MITITDQTTKPSRLKRRQKRRWKISDLIKSGLTDCYMAAILTALSPHVTVGIRTPNKAARGHYQTWFFCTHQKHISILLWWDVLSRPLKVWPRLGGSSNLIHSTAQRFEPMGGGLSLLQGLSA